MNGRFFERDARHFFNVAAFHAKYIPEEAKEEGEEDQKGNQREDVDTIDRSHVVFDEFEHLTCLIRRCFLHSARL